MKLLDVGEPAYEHFRLIGFTTTRLMSTTGGDQPPVVY